MVKKYGIYAVLAVLFLSASFLIYHKLHPKQLPKNLVAASGNIDGDLIALNTKYSGRILSLPIQDGQKIKKTQTIAQLQSDEYGAQFYALDASIKSAKAQLYALEVQNGIAKTDIPLQTQKAKRELEIAVSHEKELRSSLGSIEAQFKQDETDFSRRKSLYEKNLISGESFEYAKLKEANSKNSYNSAKEQLLGAQKSIEIAKYGVKLAQNAEQNSLALDAQVEAAKKNIQSLESQKEQIKIIINDLRIQSPVDGFVVEKVANVGEVLTAGMVVATLIDPSSLYLKIFVDTMENGKIHVGDDAVIFLDANAKRPIAAKVIRIAQNAEFTPKEVSVRSDRIQRVYAVYLKPLHVDPLLKLGIPAIGIISLDGGDLPKSLDDIPAL